MTFKAEKRVLLEMTHKMLPTLTYRQQYNQLDHLEAESYQACEKATPRLLVSPREIKKLHKGTRAILSDPIIH